MSAALIHVKPPLLTLPVIGEQAGLKFFDCSPTVWV
jgi:hypothetical protein